MAIIQRVNSGDPPGLNAETFNFMLDAARRVNPLAGVSALTGGREQPLTKIIVENLSGVDLPEYSIVGLRVPVILPSADADVFCERPAMQGDTPAIDESYDDTGRFAILLEPIPANNTGMAAVAGVVPVKLYLGGDDTDVQAAECHDGDHDYLYPDPAGSAQVLWHDTGPGEVWALVRIPHGGDNTLIPFELYDTIAGGPGIAGTAHRLDEAGNVDSSDEFEVVDYHVTRWSIGSSDRSEGVRGARGLCCKTPECEDYDTYQIVTIEEIAWCTGRLTADMFAEDGTATVDYVKAIKKDTQVPNGIDDDGDTLLVTNGHQLEGKLGSPVTLQPNYGAESTDDWLIIQSNGLAKRIQGVVQLEFCDDYDHGRIKGPWTGLDGEVPSWFDAGTTETNPAIIGVELDNTFAEYAVTGDPVIICRMLWTEGATAGDWQIEKVKNHSIAVAKNFKIAEENESNPGCLVAEMAKAKVLCDTGDPIPLLCFTEECPPDE